MAQPPAVALAPGVWRIPTLGAYWVNSYALTDDDGSVMLVDSGLERAPARIVAGLEAIGKHPSEVTRIVLSHAHADHAGGAAEMARRTGAPVAVHDGDAGYAEAGSPPKQDRSIAAGRIFARLIALAHGPEILDGARGAVREFLARAPRPRA